MENRTNIITEEQLAESLRSHKLALIFLGVVLFIVTALGCLAIYLIYRKLRQHEKDILELSDAENGLRHAKEKYAKKTNNKNSAYSAIGLSSDGHESVSMEALSRHQTKSSCCMSVKIRQKKTNVYGCAPNTSQVMMIAQDYYKAVTKTKDAVPTESIQMSGKHTGNSDRVSNVFTEDWREGRATSMLLDNLGTPADSNVTNNKAVFIHKSVGQSGGKLELSGVTLNIPKGALDASTLITLGILWEEIYYPQMTKKKSLLSPVILCQPSGIKFKSPVILTFPHCAETITEDWNVTIMKRSGDLTEPSEWSEADFNDFKEIDINANSISLKLDHFTLYTCVGEPRDGKAAAKSVHLVAFVSPLSPGSLFKPRIYCLNNYREELKDVEYLTSKMVPGTKLTETTNLIVHDNEEDLVVKLDKLSEKWKLKGGDEEVLPFEQVWHALAPHVTFLIKPEDSFVSEIRCDFTCYQIKREKHKAKLKIAEEKSKSVSPLTACPEYPDQELINEIIIHLDPVTIGGSGDWRDLAEKLGCDLARIKWLGTQSSPTRLLIDMWLEENHDLSELKQIMVEMNRLDVAEAISKRYLD